MRFWVDFWTWFFFLSLASFAGLSIVVGIGGFLNIRALLKNLRSRRG